MKIGIVSLALIAGLFTGAPAAFAAPVLVTGMVIDSNGDPAPGLPVVVLRTDPDSIVASSTSGPDGSFVFTLEEGVFDFLVDPPGDSRYSGARVPGVDTSVVRDVTLSVIGPSVTWSGRLVDASGDPVYAQYTPPGAQWPTSTRDGVFTYTFDHVPATLSGVGFASESGDFNWQIRAQVDRVLTADYDEGDVPIAVTRDLAVDAVDDSGDPVNAAIRVECSKADAFLGDASAEWYTDTYERGSSVVAAVPDWPGCVLKATATDHVDVELVVPEGASSVRVVLERVIRPTVTWSGRLVDASGDPVYAQYTPPGAQWPTSTRDGVFTYTFDHVPATLSGVGFASESGDFNWQIRAQVDRVLTADYDEGDVEILAVSPVTVRAVDRTLSPLPVESRIVCQGKQEYFGGPADVSTEDYGRLSVEVLYALAEGTARECELLVTTDQDSRSWPLPAVDEVTVLVAGGFVYFIAGGLESTSDGDNVADVIEMLGPNSGDGNDDGTPDSDQPNVTSLPTLGARSVGETNYVTVAAPGGTVLANVYTIDPLSSPEVETPPPPAVVLPEGLTSWTLQSIEPGSDQTISIYSASTSGITGYAKYDPNTQAWALLPDERVQVHGDRVDITLTDGGVGDDDGAANGVITDPGGIAIVTDATPPVITGAIRTESNAAGWYSTEVYVDWTAVDETDGELSGPESSRLGEGAGQVATSDEVCDSAGNCATGLVSGLNIDLTPPTVDDALLGLSPLAAGQSTTLSVTAGDDLSGIVGGEWYLVADDAGTGEGTPLDLEGAELSGSVHAGASAGVFPIGARAVDAAGNWSQIFTTYLVVYDPSAGFATGGGWLVPGGKTSDTGDALPGLDGTSKANFGFVVKYKNGSSTVPGGNLQFKYKSGDFRLKSTSMDWLVVTNANWARFRGLGEVDGLDGVVPFRVDARDSHEEGKPDRFVIRIWAPSSDPDVDPPLYKASGDIEGGQVTIHRN